MSQIPPPEPQPQTPQVPSTPVPESSTPPASPDTSTSLLPGTPTAELSPRSQQELLRSAVLALSEFAPRFNELVTQLAPAEYDEDGNLIPVNFSRLEPGLNIRRVAANDVLIVFRAEIFTGGKLHEVISTSQHLAGPLKSSMLPEAPSTFEAALTTHINKPLMASLFELAQARAGDGVFAHGTSQDSGPQGLPPAAPRSISAM